MFHHLKVLICTIKPRDLPFQLDFLVILLLSTLLGDFVSVLLSRLFLIAEINVHGTWERDMHLVFLHT